MIKGMVKFTSVWFLKIVGVSILWFVAVWFIFAMNNIGLGL